MSFSLRRAVAAFGCGFLALICSCEKHHVGELPEHGAHDRAPEAGAVETAPPPAPSRTATPAEFFPEQSPR